MRMIIDMNWEKYRRCGVFSIVDEYILLLFPWNALQILRCFTMLCMLVIIEIERGPNGESMCTSLSLLMARINRYGGHISGQVYTVRDQNSVWDLGRCMRWVPGNWPHFTRVC